MPEVWLTDADRRRLLEWAGFLAGWSKLYTDDVPLVQKLGGRVTPSGAIVDTHAAASPRFEVDRKDER